eukprot:1064328-Amorphochlora_amoeboformis.AAC.1
MKESEYLMNNFNPVEFISVNRAQVSTPYEGMPPTTDCLSTKSQYVSRVSPLTGDVIILDIVMKKLNRTSLVIVFKVVGVSLFTFATRTGTEMGSESASTDMASLIYSKHAHHSNTVILSFHYTCDKRGGRWGCHAGTVTDLSGV